MLNRVNPNRRFEIIGHNIPSNSNYGIHRFNDCTLDQLKQLVDEGYCDPEKCQNYSPTVGELITSGSELSQLGIDVKYEGYIVSEERSDYRVSIEGIVLTSANGLIRWSHVKEWRDADEFEYDDSCTSFRAWWD